MAQRTVPEQLLGAYARLSPSQRIKLVDTFVAAAMRTDNRLPSWLRAASRASFGARARYAPRKKP